MIASTPGSPLRITLRVYDYARLDPAMLTRAREVTSAIFKESGVETAWVDCPISAADYERYPGCHRRAETTHFVLRVMPSSMAVRLPTSDHPLGFANECRDDQPGCVANVFYARVAELARRSGTPPATVLGHVMAHEVGHLLLGPNSDASKGIMCGEWSLDDLRLMNWHYLVFTPAQSEQLQGSLLRRSTLEADSAPNVSEVPSEPAHRTQVALAAQAKVTLRVYNYAHLDPALLTSVREVTTAIFKEAGVETSWVDCPLTLADFEHYPACQQKMQTTDFVLRFMTAAMAAKLPTSDGPLGLAQRCPDDERGCVANISYMRVDELAVQGDTRAPRILGHAVAHEVGHLLLGPNAHSSNGIMRGLWTPDDLRFMNWSYLFFTPRQCGQLRASLARRSAMEVSLASDTSGPS